MKWPFSSAIALGLRYDPGRGGHFSGLLLQRVLVVGE